MGKVLALIASRQDEEGFQSTAASGSVYRSCIRNALAEQDRSLELYAPIGDEPMRYAVMHRDIIARFGRFPHRNALLGRVTTAEEQAFLDDGGFAG